MRVFNWYHLTRSPLRDNSTNSTNMKLFACIVLLGVASAARLDNTYLPPNSARTAGGNGNFLAAPSGSFQASQRSSFAGQGQHNAPTTSYGAPQRSYEPSPVYGPASSRSNSAEARANTLRFDNDNDGTGNYRFAFETENRISQQEQGELKHVTEGEATVVQGSYSYTGDDGKTYTVNYIADENGFQPTGEHIDQAISMAAADAARSAKSGGQQQGYNYNAQYSGQQGYNGQQQQAGNGGYRY